MINIPFHSKSIVNHLPSVFQAKVLINNHFHLFFFSYTSLKRVITIDEKVFPQFLLLHVRLPRQLPYVSLYALLIAIISCFLISFLIFNKNCVYWPAHAIQPNSISFLMDLSFSSVFPVYIFFTCFIYMYGNVKRRKSFCKRKNNAA